MQAKRLLAKKKAAAQKKSATSAASQAAAREAKERAKKAKGKKDTSHFNQVLLSGYRLSSINIITRCFCQKRQGACCM